MATGFCHLRAGTNGPVQTPAATPAWFYWARCASKRQIGRSRFGVKCSASVVARYRARPTLNPERSTACKAQPAQPPLFYQPIRSSPKFAKANSIVWMIPNERVGAWMPLGRVCVIGFGKRGNSWDAGQRGSQGDTSPCIIRGRSPQKAVTQWQLNQPGGAGRAGISLRLSQWPQATKNQGWLSSVSFTRRFWARLLSLSLAVSGRVSA